MDQGKKKWERHLLNMIPCSETELRRAVSMTDEELVHFLREKMAQKEAVSHGRGDIGQ